MPLQRINSFLCPYLYILNKIINLAFFVVVFLLKCAVQCYAWGKLGLESEVAQLNHSSDESFVIGSNIPYAEVCI